MLLLALTTLGCTSKSSDDTATPENYVDERMTAADYADASADATIMTGVDEIIEPGQDIMWCIAGTYAGDDAGIVKLKTYQGQYGHHLQLYGTSLGDLDLPDGTVYDCTSSNDIPMNDLEPIAFTTDANTSDVGVTIPDGFAVKLDAGQRWVLQSHYVNTGTSAIRIQDVAALNTVPTDEVTTWAAPFFINHQNFALPPHAATHEEYTVTLKQDLNVLALLGHLHEWGTAFATQLVDGDTSTDIYSVPVWQSAYRDSPPMDSYAPGELTLSQGSVIRNSCDWYNDTDTEIDFPHEMCVTVGLVYPFTAPVTYSD